MNTICRQSAAPRYTEAAESKAYGATYTPKALADFVAGKIVSQAGSTGSIVEGQRTRVLDPAVGDGELLVSLLNRLKGCGSAIEIQGFETDIDALHTAKERLAKEFPRVVCRVEQRSFLSFVLDRFHSTGDLFAGSNARYDIVIANPPYVRTQVMGATQAQKLARLFGLSGRVDLYHAFVVGISRVLADNGVTGIIVSNRFMSTRSGASVRATLSEQFNVLHAWDLGDTKLFDAAILPAVLLAQGRRTTKRRTRFTSIYETSDDPAITVANPIEALKEEGIVAVDDGRRFVVRHGDLTTSGTSSGVWRIATKKVDDWLTTVQRRRWRTFGDVGRVRVGVKTCADKVFIRDDWSVLSECGRPELLQPLTTHHVARQYKAVAPERSREILYPHEVAQGCRRAVDLHRYPISRAYLDSHRRILERRRYVMDAGRAWYELWVPQDPSAWPKPKLVFRDIAEKPEFWIDMTGSVVNGDCYWLMSDTPMDGLEQDILWLAAAVGNSTFIERFYDYRFNNKLYAGRRRFATQYVEQFPLPNPHSALGKAIVAKAKETFENIEASEAGATIEELDSMVWHAFDLRPQLPIGR